MKGENEGGYCTIYAVGSGECLQRENAIQLLNSVTYCDLIIQKPWNFVRTFKCLAFAICVKRCFVYV